MRVRAQGRLSSFAVHRGLLGLLIAAALGVASCSDEEGTESPPREAVGEECAPDSRPWQTEFRRDIAVTLASQMVRQCNEFRYLEESSDPSAYLVQCLETGDEFHVVPSSGEVTNTWKPGMPPPKPLKPPSRRKPLSSTPRSLQADPDDMRQARKFLADLPPACVTERWSSMCPAPVVRNPCKVRSVLKMVSLQTCVEGPPNQATHRAAAPPVSGKSGPLIRYSLPCQAR